MTNYAHRIEQDNDPIPPWEDECEVIYRLDAGRYMRIWTEGDIPEDYKAHAVYAYIHSGIVLSLHPFHCPWDSGPVGYIYTPHDPKPIIETLNQYFSGDVWGYIIERDGEHYESCWGFYGHDYCEQEAKSIVRHLKQQKLKQYIKHHVPLEARVCRP